MLQITDCVRVPTRDHLVRITGFVRIEGRAVVRCLSASEATHFSHYAICGGFSRIADATECRPVAWKAEVIERERDQWRWLCARMRVCRDVRPEHLP